MKHQEPRPADTVQTGWQVILRLLLGVGVVIAIVIVFKLIAG